MEDLALGRWFVCSSAHVKKKKTVRFFFLLYFRDDCTWKDRTRTYHSRQFPRKGMEK